MRRVQQVADSEAGADRAPQRGVTTAQETKFLVRSRLPSSEDRLQGRACCQTVIHVWHKQLVGTSGGTCRVVPRPHLRDEGRQTKDVNLDGHTTASMWK